VAQVTAKLSRTPTDYRWPPEGFTRVPYWVYTDEEIYRREQEKIFGGPTWNYVALEVEIPNPGDFVKTSIGDRSVIVVRDKDGSINVIANSCAHRGVAFCKESRGNSSSFTCPYHQWNYDLKGQLVGIPFRRGYKKQGGMPEDFDMSQHNVRPLKVHTRNGVIFASFDHNVEPFETYIGKNMLLYFDRVFDGRELKVLGYERQSIDCNWKLMFENIKDPYHASVLHVFLMTFGLFRMDQESAVEMDETGMHSALISRRAGQASAEAAQEMKNNLRSDFTLEDPNLLDVVKEFPGNNSVVMLTLFPNIIVQQQSNTLAMRQLVTRSPGVFELHWTFFGYANDSEEMTNRRVRQANLMGPSGLVSVDDSEVLAMSQTGLFSYDNNQVILEMGGREVKDTNHMITEVAIRGFYQHYVKVMGL
jgi:salicylate 5-hydroxylase large subunit